MSEREFHDWLTRRLACNDQTVLAGTGVDDCAHVTTENISRLAFSTDTIVEGSHYKAEDDPLHIGYKAVAASLSDLAASGCAPRWGLIALTLRKGLGDRWAMRLMEGIAGCARKYNLSLVGGDTTSAYGPTSVNITVAGEPYGKEAIRRDGAKYDDLIMVTGELGGSILGRHMTPEPRFMEIEKLISIVEVNSCMDITDGLAVDLNRLLNSSHLGATIEEAEIPVSEAAQKLSQTSGKRPVEHALSDGEDFELLFTVPHGSFGTIRKHWKECNIKTPISCIGRVERTSGLHLAGLDGTVNLLPPLGYEHEF